ncbi:hypothetical protein EV651_101202 [Kribbella sp. VKM Ac-2571]|nr:hypothetical protein EV651_101202 [Kribbella sp. VKM Ac-2571]
MKGEGLEVAGRRQVKAELFVEFAFEGFRPGLARFGTASRQV